jgi:hypothetical protein
MGMGINPCINGNKAIALAAGMNIPLCVGTI